MTKSCCPAGHQNFYLKPASQCKYTSCDICFKNVLENGNGCVDDPECDIAVCAKCYESLEDGPGHVLDLKNFILKSPN